MKSLGTIGVLFFLTSNAVPLMTPVSPAPLSYAESYDDYSVVFIDETEEEGRYRSTFLIKNLGEGFIERLEIGAKNYDGTYTYYRVGYSVNGYQADTYYDSIFKEAVIPPHKETYVSIIKENKFQDIVDLKYQVSAYLKPFL